MIRQWRALAVTLAAGFMSLLDVSIVNVALPSIREGLNASEAGLQWILSGYALTFGLVLVPAGRLGDARSRRAVFMSGLALFTASSALAGLAPTVAFLVVAEAGNGDVGVPRQRQRHRLAAVVGNVHQDQRVGVELAVRGTGVQFGQHLLGQRVSHCWTMAWSP